MAVGLSGFWCILGLVLYGVYTRLGVGSVLVVDSKLRSGLGFFRSTEMARYCTVE